MARKNKKNGAAQTKQRRRFDHSLHPHTRPGTIIVPAGAEAPVLRVTCYGPDEIVERHNASLKQIRELRGKHPVMWIEASGFGDAELIEQLGKLLELHRLSLEDMVTIPQRSKIEDFPSHLFALTQIPSYNGCLSAEQISIFVGAGFVLSWSERPSRVFDIVHKRLQVVRGTTRSAGVDYLFYALLDAVIDSYFPVLEQLGEVFDELDDRVDIDGDVDTKLIDLMRSLRHDVRQLRRVVWPLRDAVDDLVRSPPPMISDEALIHFRDCHDHTVQIMDTLENYRDAGSDVRDYYATAISNRMNETIKVLTIISTIFMPLTFIAGIYGMNFHWSPDKPTNMPELGWKYGYVSALALMGAVAAGQLYFFRRKGWIGRSRRRQDAAASKGGEA
jgi:magnesium transporter